MQTLTQHEAHHVSVALHAFGMWLVTAGLVDEGLAGCAVAAFVRANELPDARLRVGEKTVSIDPEFVREAVDTWRQPEPEQFRRTAVIVRKQVEEENERRVGR